MTMNLNHVQSVEELSDLAVRTAARLLRADGGALYLLDEQEEMLVEPTAHRALPLDGPGMAPWCAFHRESAVLPPGDPRRAPAVDGDRSAVAVPILAEGRVRGALLATRASEQPFQDGDRRRLEDLAQDVGAALLTLDVRTDLQSYTLHAEEWLVAAVERAAPGGAGHVWRVCQIAALLAQRLGFAPPEVERIQVAARYHDLGWILAADRKPGEIQRLHAASGAAALHAVRTLQGAAALVEVHHERYDGSGYPAGLSGAAIPLEGYVLACAEDLDEHLAQQRVTRPAEALSAFLDQQAAVHHPRVLAACAELARGSRLPALFA